MQKKFEQWTTWRPLPFSYQLTSGKPSTPTATEVPKRFPANPNPATATHRSAFAGRPLALEPEREPEQLPLGV